MIVVMVLCIALFPPLIVHFIYLTILVDLVRSSFSHCPHSVMVAVLCIALFDAVCDPSTQCQVHCSLILHCLPNIPPSDGPEHLLSSVHFIYLAVLQWYPSHLAWTA